MEFNFAVLFVRQVQPACHNRVGFCSFEFVKIDILEQIPAAEIFFEDGVCRRKVTGVYAFVTTIILEIEFSPAPAGIHIQSPP